jgi:hypothetical protein
MTAKNAQWRRYAYACIACEISSMTRYYDQLIQYARVAHDTGLLLELVDCPTKTSIETGHALPDLTADRDRRSAILLNGTLNHSTDIQGLLAEIRPSLGRTARVIAVLYNPYFAWLYRLAWRLGLREGALPTTFISFTDLLTVARLSGFRLVRTRAVLYSPFRLAGLGSALNAILTTIPVLRHLSFTSVVTLAPVAGGEQVSPPSLTVVIPARNERGNIQTALEELRAVRHELPGLEVIFVEGHSTDGTWDEIARLMPEYEPFFRIRALQQRGRGKGDAARLGLSEATGDVLTILDADLTMPPAMLGRFYDAYHRAHGELVNGSRLVYGLEDDAMRFLNRLGNVFFAKALSRVLSVRIGDSLCGTKLFARHDYARFTAWRRDFGDFDPFGDFELLFPAAILGLTVIDVPVRYGARRYGTTNISRFSHGWMLLKMTTVGFWRVRVGRVP